MIAFNKSKVTDFAVFPIKANVQFQIHVEITHFPRAQHIWEIYKIIAHLYVKSMRLFNPNVMCPTKFLVVSSGNATLACADSPWSGLVTLRLRGTRAWEACAKWGSISTALSQSLSSCRGRSLGSFSEQGLVIELSDVFFPTVSKILGFQQTKDHMKYAGILFAFRCTILGTLVHLFRTYWRYLIQVCTRGPGKLGLEHLHCKRCRTNECTCPRKCQLSKWLLK